MKTTFLGGTKKLISLYRLLTVLHTLKDCEKTNEDRNVIPKAAKSWVKNPESAWVRLVLALKLLLKKPTRTFERSEIVKFGAPPKIFFQNFRKFFPKFLVLLELRFYLCSFSRNLSEYGGIVLKFQKFHESISWLYRAETAVMALCTVSERGYAEPHPLLPGLQEGEGGSRHQQQWRRSEVLHTGDEDQGGDKRVLIKFWQGLQIVDCTASLPFGRRYARADPHTPSL